MTRAANGRIAGVTFLVYIAAGVIAMQTESMLPQATGLLTLFASFSALVLAVTLYALTRDVDPDLALLALACRVTEGVLGAVAISGSLALLSAGSGNTSALDTDAVRTLFRRARGLNTAVGASFFAAGSMIMSCLFLRGRMIPTPLSSFGILASGLLIIALPLQLAGVLRRPATLLIWLPMLVFEILLGLWLISRGAASAATSPFAGSSHAQRQGEA